MSAERVFCPTRCGRSDQTQSRQGGWSDGFRTCVLRVRFVVDQETHDRRDRSPREFADVYEEPVEQGGQ
jgi:hypothetical protein